MSVFAEREFDNAVLRLPFGKASLKITLDSSRCLISLLGSLGEQLHDDCETAVRIPFNLTHGGVGCRAIWLCTSSIGSDAVKGSVPVSIS